MGSGKRSPQIFADERRWEEKPYHGDTEARRKPLKYGGKEKRREGSPTSTSGERPFAADLRRQAQMRTKPTTEHGDTEKAFWNSA
jgi:hypothetical protein